MKKPFTRPFLTIILLSLTFTCFALAQEPPAAASQKVIVHAGKLLDVRSGKTLTDQAIVIESGKIVSVGSMSQAKRSSGDRVVTDEESLRRDFGQARRERLRLEAPARHLARRRDGQGLGARRQVLLRGHRGQAGDPRRNWMLRSRRTVRPGCRTPKAYESLQLLDGNYEGRFPVLMSLLDSQQQACLSQVIRFYSLG